MRLAPIFAATLPAILLAGCLAPRSDLSAPAFCRELDAPPVAVATDLTLLPVVTTDSPRDRSAALFLAGVLEETCGRRPPVLVELSGQRANVTNGIFVGKVTANAGWECPLAAESPDAFRVVAAEGSVRFLGRVDFAVADWCERYLGFRFYCTEGRCADRRDAIAVSAVDYADRPVFAHRVFDGIPSGGWTRLAKTGSSHRGGVNVHAPHGWFKDPKVLAEHPAIFETGRSPMLCYGKSETLDYYKRRIDRHIAGVEDSGGIVDTNRQVVTVSPWDAPIACTCACCRAGFDAALGERGSASPIVWGAFLAKLDAWLGAAHPGYEISFLPYLNFRSVPPALGPLSVSEAEVCVMPGLALMKEPSVRAEEEALLRAWQAATGRKVLAWDYACWPHERMTAPYVFGRTLQRHYRANRDVLAGSFVCGAREDPRLALSLYVWTRCLWNPDFDVETLYDEFARRMFGAGAAEMRKLIALEEEAWERVWGDGELTFRNLYEMSYPPALVARLTALTVCALAKARMAGDAQAVERIHWYAGSLLRVSAETALLDAKARKVRRIIRPGETNRFVIAQDVCSPLPRFGTTLVASWDGPALVLDVRAAVADGEKLDFARLREDFVHGTENLFFVLDDGTGAKSCRVYPGGDVEGGLKAAATVTHDATSWRVVLRVPLSAEALARGSVAGNVARWSPDANEQSRLETRYSRPDDDPSAFVAFSAKKTDQDERTRGKTK